MKNGVGLTGTILGIFLAFGVTGGACGAELPHLLLETDHTLIKLGNHVVDEPGHKIEMSEVSLSGNILRIGKLALTKHLGTLEQKAIIDVPEVKVEGFSVKTVNVRKEVVLASFPNVDIKFTPKNDKAVEIHLPKRMEFLISKDEMGNKKVEMKDLEAQRVAMAKDLDDRLSNAALDEMIAIDLSGVPEVIRPLAQAAWDQAKPALFDQVRAAIRKELESDQFANRIASTLGNQLPLEVKSPLELELCLGTGSTILIDGNDAFFEEYAPKEAQNLKYLPRAARVAFVRVLLSKTVVANHAATTPPMTVLAP